MAMTADYIAAHREHLSDILQSPRPAPELGGISGMGTNLFTLSVLHCSIRGIEFEMDILDRYAEVGTDRERSRCLLRIPGEIAESVRSIDASNVESVNARWATSRELSHLDWNHSAASRVLLALSDYFNAHRDKDIYLCTPA